nr:hypothetical protein [Tanacetum cinerariifolium]
EIFAELARMGYEKPPPKLTFYKAFFSDQWKFLIHMIVQCMSAKRTTWNEFSSSMASAIICLTIGRKFNFSKYIFDSMVRNVDSLSKFLMYSQFLQVMINAQVDDLSSHNTKYTSPVLIQKVVANMRRIGKGFSGVETPLPQVQDAAKVDAEDEDDNEVSAAPTPPSTTQAPSPPPQEHIPSPPEAQPAPPLSPPQKQPSQPTDTSESSMTILNTLMETCATLEEEEIQAFWLWMLKRMHPNRGKIAQLDADEDVTLVDIDTAVEMDADIQGRIEDDVTAVKEVNAAEPTVFDDEEVTMTMAQTLIKIKAEKARIIDEKMAKRLQDEEIEQMQEKRLDNIKKYQSLKRKPIFVAQARKNMIVYLKNMVGYKIQHFKGMTYDQVRPVFEREYNKVQTFIKPDRDEEPTKKRAAKYTLPQKTFKKLRAKVEVLGSSSTQQDTPTIDPVEISKEDVENMLQIFLMVEFKVEALQVKVGGITQAFQSFKNMLKDFDRENLDALWRLVKERFSTALPTVDKEKALWAELTRLYKPNANDVFWKRQRYMHYPIIWKLHSNYGVHQVSSTTRRYDIYMLAETDYALSNQVMNLMLNSRLQVEEDSEVARDLVMKIFLKDNQPKRRSLDTSSK